MKTLISICLLATLSFGNDFSEIEKNNYTKIMKQNCSDFTDKTKEYIELMRIDLDTGDINSLDINYIFFNKYIDIAILSCDKNMSKVLMESKQKVGKIFE